MIKLILFLLFLLIILYISFPLVLICGDSMVPALQDGQIVLSRRVIFKRSHVYETGDIYVFKQQMQMDDEPRELVVKRLNMINYDNGGLYFLGDNSEHSFDSRAYGFVARKDVVAKLLIRKGELVWIRK